MSAKRAAGLRFLPASWWCRPGLSAPMKKLNEMGRSLSYSNDLHFTAFLESNATNFIKDTTFYYFNIISFKLQTRKTRIMTQNLFLVITVKTVIGALFISVDLYFTVRVGLKATGCCHVLSEQRYWYHGKGIRQAGVQTRPSMYKVAVQPLTFHLYFLPDCRGKQSYQNATPVDGKLLTTHILAL